MEGDTGYFLDAVVNTHTHTHTDDVVVHFLRKYLCKHVMIWANIIKTKWEDLPINGLLETTQQEGWDSSDDGQPLIIINVMIKLC